MTRYCLAQINVGRMSYPLEDPRMEGFRSQLDAINALADRSPGFVWRLQSDEGDATAIRAFDDPMMLVNLSVWTDVDALFEYVYHSDHVKVFANRGQWFEKLDTPQLACWWLPAGELPTLEEGRRRLALLGERGPTAEAFTIKQRFPPPS